MFDTTGFWILFFCTVVTSAALPDHWVRLRGLLLIGVSLLVLGWVGNMTTAQLTFIVAAAAWIIATVQFAHRWSCRDSLWVLLAAIVPIATLWVLGKSAVGFQLSQLSFFHLLGFSYFIVKAWTLLKDYQSGQLAETPDPAVMGAYFFHFPTYFMGPMHLFGEFDKSFRDPRYPDGAGWVDVAYRIALGLVKVKLLAPLLVPLSLTAVSESGTTSVLAVMGGSFVYSLVILLDFSGYSDLAIATGRLMGIQTPENFRQPYLAANIRDFWQRWHITFSRVLTSYVFIPLSRALHPRIGNRPKLVMIVCYLLTFLLCGYWHGATANFLLWGLYHALGLAAYDVYRQYSMKRRLRRGGSRVPTPLARAVGVCATFSFVSVGWIFFVLPASTFSATAAAVTQGGATMQASSTEVAAVGQSNAPGVWSKSAE